MKRRPTLPERRHISEALKAIAPRKTLSLAVVELVAVNEDVA
ncbi:MAG TPA: hypothetical protein VGB17_06265 [Pyrinomonadaceae bacterium]